MDTRPTGRIVERNADGVGEGDAEVVRKAEQAGGANRKM